MGTTSLIGKVWKVLDPPAAPRRRRRSHRRAALSTTPRDTGAAGRLNGWQRGHQIGRGWRCQACSRRTVDPCTEVSDGMPPCGFCIACCPGHPDTDKGRRTDTRAQNRGSDGGRFRSSVQKAGE
jgi:hypothetical protein